MVRLTLPVPPSGNAAYRTGHGHFYRSKEAQAYHDSIGLICRVKKIMPIEGPVWLDVRWYRARRAGDLGNRCKVLEDALQGYAYENDSQIAKLTAERFEDKRYPRMEVTITAYAYKEG